MSETFLPFSERRRSSELTTAASMGLPGAAILVWGLIAGEFALVVFGLIFLAIPARILYGHVRAAPERDAHSTETQSDGLLAADGRLYCPGWLPVEGVPFEEIEGYELRSSSPGWELTLARVGQSAMPRISAICFGGDFRETIPRFMETAGIPPYVPPGARRDT